MDPHSRIDDLATDVVDVHHPPPGIRALCALCAPLWWVAFRPTLLSECAHHLPREELRRPEALHAAEHADEVGDAERDVLAQAADDLLGRADDGVEAVGIAVPARRALGEALGEARRIGLDDDVAEPAFLDRR